MRAYIIKMPVYNKSKYILNGSYLEREERPNTLPSDLLTYDLHHTMHIIFDDYRFEKKDGTFIEKVIITSDTIWFYYNNNTERNMMINTLQERRDIYLTPCFERDLFNENDPQNDITYIDAINEDTFLIYLFILFVCCCVAKQTPQNIYPLLNYYSYELLDQLCGREMIDYLYQEDAFVDESYIEILDSLNKDNPIHVYVDQVQKLPAYRLEECEGKFTVHNCAQIFYEKLAERIAESGYTSGYLRMESFLNWSINELYYLTKNQNIQVIDNCCSIKDFIVENKYHISASMYDNNGIYHISYVIESDSFIEHPEVILKEDENIKHTFVFIFADTNKLTLEYISYQKNLKVNVAYNELLKTYEALNYILSTSQIIEDKDEEEDFSYLNWETWSSSQLDDYYGGSYEDE